MDAQPPIEIVEHHQLSLLESEAIRRRPDSSDDVEKWERYHEALCCAAKACGRKVGEDPLGKIDFYHGGDWSHELSDGFAMRSPRAVSAKAFRQFHSVVSAHDPNAMLLLQGELFTPIFGLEVLIMPSGIQVAWKEQTPEECRKALRKLGLNLESGDDKQWWEFWK
jgi:hypothetical protein